MTTLPLGVTPHHPTWTTVITVVVATLAACGDNSENWPDRSDQTGTGSEPPAIDVLALDGSEIVPPSVEYAPNGTGLPGVALSVPASNLGTIRFRTNRPMLLAALPIGSGGQNVRLVSPSGETKNDWVTDKLTPPGVYQISFTASVEGGAILIGGINSVSDGATSHPMSFGPGLSDQGVADWAAFWLVGQLAKYLSETHGVNIGCPALKDLVERDFGLYCPISFWNPATCITRYAMTCSSSVQ